MMGLWADGWFYISSAGLLISGILFFFLLGQYRIASEAADATEDDHIADQSISAPAAIRPVYIPDETSSAPIISHADKPDAKPASAPKTEEPPLKSESRKDPASTTGGVSPAVVYLQNIKSELADLHKDLRSLAKRVNDELASVSTRDEALIERLGELTRAVEQMKAARPAAEPVEPAPAPAPKKVRKIEKAPESVPAPAIEVVLPTPIETPQTEPTRLPDETVRLESAAPPPVEPEPVVSIAASPEPTPEPAPAPAPAPTEPEPAPAEEKPRRGPVWPV
jgi:hypothetical protein